MGQRTEWLEPSVDDLNVIGRHQHYVPKADPTAWVSPESASSVIAFMLSDDARDVSRAALPVYGRA